MQAYIRYGNDGEPIATEVAECREKMLQWQEKGCNIQPVATATKSLQAGK